jgi:hypothetical protein
MRDFLSFRTMITPGLIKVVYPIGAVLLVLAPLAVLFFSAKHPVPGAPGLSIEMSWSSTLLTILLGNVGWRTCCENLILLFSIQTALVDSVKSGAKPGG